MLELLVPQCRRPVVHVRELSIASRANANSPHAHLTNQNIKSHLRQSGHRLSSVTPKQPKANSIHTAAY